MMRRPGDNGQAAGPGSVRALGLAHRRYGRLTETEPNVLLVREIARHTQRIHKIIRDAKVKLTGSSPVPTAALSCER
jgi:hypothetical protein